MEPARLRHGSTSSGVTPGGATSSGSRSGSSSERVQGSEPSPTRHERRNLAASVAGSQHSSTAPIPMPHVNSVDDGGISPRTAHFDAGSPRDTHHRHSRRHPSWARRKCAGSPQQHLPSLSDVLDGGKAVADTPLTDINAGGSGAPRLVSDGPSALAPARVPLLRHEPSSNSTTASRSSTGNFGRIPGEGPVPIHALLADRTVLGAGEMERQSVPAIKAAVNQSVHQNPRPQLLTGPRGYGTSSPRFPRASSHGR